MVAESIRASWIKVPQRGVTLWHEFESHKVVGKIIEIVWNLIALWNPSSAIRGEHWNKYAVWQEE